MSGHPRGGWVRIHARDADNWFPVSAQSAGFKAIGGGPGVKKHVGLI